jgi:hypothetical protein
LDNVTANPLLISKNKMILKKFKNKNNRTKRILRPQPLLIVIFFLFNFLLVRELNAIEEMFPQPTGAVNDFASIVPPDTKSAMEGLSREVLGKTVTAVVRRRYNEAVRAYNVAIRKFPSNLIAKTFTFKKASFFEAPEAATEAPKVKF